MVGEVAREVRDVTVGLDEHPVPRIPELAGLEPGGTVLLVNETSFVEEFDRLCYGS